jgi:hypothetical protein
VAGEARPLDGEYLARAEKALSHLHAPAEFDSGAAEARLTELLGAMA